MAAGIIGDMMKWKSAAEIRQMFSCGCDKRDEMGEEQEILTVDSLFGESEVVPTGKLVLRN